MKMSAFIVSDNLLNDTLNFIMLTVQADFQKLSPVSSALTMKYIDEKGHKHLDMTDSEKLEELGRHILMANYDSVNKRYKSKEWPHDFKYKYNYSKISLGQYLKNLDCISYQCSEVNNYYEGEFYKLIIRLKEYGIDQLDGYSQAKWGY
jgi:hypothetical protein